MHLSEVKIKNYKGFEYLSLQFHPKLNVFIGSNGSGKTSLLKALMKSIFGLTRKFATPVYNDTNFLLTESDTSYKTKSSYIITTINDFPKYDKTICAASQTVLPGNVADFQINDAFESQQEFVQWYSNETDKSFQTVPIFRFYPANRNNMEYKENGTYNRKYSISQLETWANIYENSFSFSRLVKWFFDRESYELRLQRDEQNFGVEDKELKGVRDSLKKTFELLGYGIVTVKSELIKRSDSSDLTPTFIIENQDNGKRDIIENKSDGERSIITLVADIAYNLALAKDFTPNNEFLNSPGVVMIDEIENHLHPTWQRQIIPILTEVFPNIQFFIATHSPQVLAAVKSESILIFQNFQVSHVDFKTKGEDSNSLLKYIFNSTERPKEYIELIEKFNHLIEQKAGFDVIQDAINQIKQIEDQDKARDIHSLMEELNLQFEAYKYDMEHEMD